MSNFLSREDILDKNDLTIEQLYIPEWGASVHIRVMSGAERDRLEAMMAQGPDQQRPQNFRALVAVLTVCDGQGGRLFDLGEVAALGEKSSVALDRIFTVASRLNALTARDRDQLQGNSNGESGGASGSDSPDTSA